MKRLIAVLSGLLVLPAFAEVVPAYYYDDITEYADVDADDDVAYDDVISADTVAPDVVAPATQGTTNISPRSAGARVSASRGTATTNTRLGTSTRNNTTGRVVSARTTSNNASRVSVSRPSATVNAARAVSNNTTKTVSSRRSATTGTNTARASIIQSDTVNTPLYTGRVGVRTTATTTRAPTVRMSATTSTTATDVTSVSTTDMDELAQVTDFCKAQYQSCMDNFCNVLDDNQGRCSCSANLKNYEKTETALKQATADLQEVAQKIQYIGLTADEVDTLFTQTAAEVQLQKSSDNTQLKNDLDKIKNAIISVKSGNATSSETGITTDLSGLLDFSFSSSGFDLSSFLGTSTNTSSISNQRGEQLYKTASARCKASVLNNCTAQGVDASVITNAYDLEIDKQCIAYERSLTDANDQMASTVRNAKSVLQKARLLVAQQKNSYDLRGCVNALDTCMQDDFVCGSDYENCLDPSGKYIVDGEIIVGSTPGESGNLNGALYTSAWGGASGANNPWSDDGSLSTYINAQVNGTPSTTSKDIAKYLQYKIGYHDDSTGRDMGMCMSVLNKCQNITYDNNGKYKPANSVVTEFLQRTLAQIKSSQDTILADYAETCTSNVSSCLSQNYYDIDNPDTGKSNLAIKACQSLINTCMSVNGVTGNLAGNSADAGAWVKSLMGKSASDYTTCATCLAANNQWTGSACTEPMVVKKGDCTSGKKFVSYGNACSVSGKTTETECTTAGGEWKETGYCLNPCE